MNTIKNLILLNPFQQSIGGKAKNLLQLKKLGIKVPKWSIIPAEVLLEQLPPQATREEIPMLFENLEVPAEWLAQLADYFGKDYATKTYAVRSSAMEEDGQQFSFAGQFETFLHVPFSELAGKIKLVWQSVVSPRVLSYREENGLPLQLGIAVIIQEMIVPEVAGVAFGMNPVDGDRDSKIISAVYGLGEGLVSGALDADTFTLTPTKTRAQVVLKSHAFVQDDRGKGMQKVEVPAEKQLAPSLEGSQLQAISDLLDRLSQELGSPQDIEFAFAQNQLYLLQTRPITTSGQHKDGEYILWDNSNIIESYPGVTTPLTFSFIKKMYAEVYAQFAELMGVRTQEVKQYANVFENTLGLIKGRVYYNLLNWYKMLAMLPGYSINAEYMENMMGVKERFELKEGFQMSKRFAWFRLMMMSFKMIGKQWKLGQQRKAFFAHLHQTIQHYQAIDFTTLPPTEIIRHYKDFEQRLLLQWKAPLVNDFFAMIWFGLLQKQTNKYCSQVSNIHNDLLCGNQDIISVEPIHQIMRISKMIQSNQNATSFFKESSPILIWQQLCNGAFPSIKKAIDHYLHCFGDRCVGELKLERIAYSQAPTLFVKVIQSYVKQGITQKRSHASLEQELRKAAEEKVAEALKGKPIRRLWFYTVLQKARDLVSNRENLRYERTRGFGMVRVMFTALGEQWYRAGHLSDPRDVFYLELEEIKALENRAFDPALSQKIAARKAEFDGYQKQKPPQQRFYTYGQNFSEEYIYSSEKLEAISGELNGIGCCPGKVRAKVRVVDNPNDIESLDGDILVTSSTDPGWVILFPTASAIIVERGSLLSHSAIVSREMGIPCIVSVAGLLRSLKTGDEILMDGSTGKIKILNA